MNFINQKKISLGLLFFASLALGMEKDTSDFYSIILPGQNGLGGESFVANHIVNTTKSKRYQTLADPTLIDLGQDNCIAHFQEQFDNDPELRNRPRTLIYGVSQGTATVVNWLAQKSHEEQERIASCLVLEAVLGSGNSAIIHTVKSGVPITRSFLFPRFLLPLAAKVGIFPSYKPWGMSALGSVEKLSPNIPIIIMHNVEDPQLSINDARAFYCALLKKGHKNAYLFEAINSPAHIDVIATDHWSERLKKTMALQAIYKKHGLPHAEIKTDQECKFTIEEFQPSMQEVINRK